MEKMITRRMQAVNNTADIPADMVVVEEESAATEDGSMEPAQKRFKSENVSERNVEQSSVKQILFNINQAICLRLDNIESKLEVLNNRSKEMEGKIDQITLLTAGLGSVPSSTPIKKTVNHVATSGGSMKRGGAVIVGLPQEKASKGNESENDDSDCQSEVMTTPTLSQEHSQQQSSSLTNLGPNVTLITLNTEEDFPTGSWLGDEHNPEMRVRVPITPSDMIHIHSNCRTAEKMALTMLDYLFDRDIQACSNLSGMGKYGKKQLDPLMIYGIRCHLIHKFAITESDWHRIKLNMDSKCRTAFRRKQKGLPLTVKAFRGKAPPAYISMEEAGEISPNNQDGLQQLQDGASVHLNQPSEADLQQAIANAFQRGQAGEMIQQGEIQVLHATPEQINQLQQGHHIQILQDGQIIQGLRSEEGEQVAVPMGQEDGEGMTAESGEELRIDHQEDQHDHVGREEEDDSEDQPQDDLTQDEGNLVVTTEGELLRIERASP
ncbi:unnamed protein product [Owenia fusiformis]|uniref:Protein BANP n=1 Tax=Owenia fusiformis TaxID=6347 RepID=A0A8J1URC7_OWEFU|nr:unnamed protein product [Owenia fusiformis]